MIPTLNNEQLWLSTNVGSFSLEGVEISKLVYERYTSGSNYKRYFNIGWF